MGIVWDQSWLFMPILFIVYYVWFNFIDKESFNMDYDYLGKRIDEQEGGEFADDSDFVSAAMFLDME